MHKKIEEQVNAAIKIIRSKIEGKFEHDQEKTFKAVINELAKIKKDETNTLVGYKFYKDAVREITTIVQAVTDDDVDRSFSGALADIAFILDRRDQIFDDILEEEEINIEQSADFILSESNAVYEMLLGLCE